MTDLMLMGPVMMILTMLVLTMMMPMMMIPIPISPTEREVMFSNDDESVKILMGMIITPQEDKWEIGERREETGERGGWGKQVM